MSQDIHDLVKPNTDTENEQAAEVALTPETALTAQCPGCGYLVEFGKQYDSTRRAEDLYD